MTPQANKLCKRNVGAYHDVGLRGKLPRYIERLHRINTTGGHTSTGVEASKVAIFRGCDFDFLTHSYRVLYLSPASLKSSLRRS
jgi:hypothetical protein